MITFIVGVGVGFVAGAFTPAIDRKIKALFAKDSTAALAAAPASVKTAVTTVETETKKL